MILFDQEEYAHFFHPLCCRNRRVYYECILQLIEKSKSVPILYETDARDTLILYLRNCKYALSDEDGEKEEEQALSTGKSETENASAILRYLRHCGWLSQKELGRNGDNIASVSPYCRKMIDAIEKVFNRDTNAALTNHIFAIYDVLHSAFVADHGRTYRPYSNILSPACDGVSDLKNELLILKDSIRSIMQVIIKLTETNELGQFMIRDEMLETFFGDYFFIKKGGLIPGYIGEIESMLRQIRGTEVYENMIREYQSLYNTEAEAARAQVDAQLDEIRSFVSYEYAREMDYIDRKINSYYHLYSTRILMVLSGGTNMQTYLNDLLMQLRDLDAETRNDILGEISESFCLESYRYIGRKSIARRKKRTPNETEGALPQAAMSDEEKARLTREILYAYPDRYGVKQTAEYVDQLMGERESIQPDQSIIRSREDAMMMAACMIYSGSSEFPYETEFLGGTVETDAALLSKIQIRRKNINYFNEEDG